MDRLEDLASAGPAAARRRERAAALARERFGNLAFVRAVVEISNHCRERCDYCGMRRDNPGLRRYRARVDQLAELILRDRPACVTDINLQGGEDPVAAREVALPLVRLLKAEGSLGVGVSLGCLDPGLHRELREAGAEVCILKFECADPDAYARYRAPGTLDERLGAVRRLAAEGWAVTSGFIAGLPGQEPSSLAANLELAASLPVRGCSVSPFIPGESTPLAACAPGSADWTLNCMAALRLMRPDWIIPAVSALHLTGPESYRRGLRSGANLVTINLTPEHLRGDYLIYRRDRFIMREEQVLAALDAEGLRPSPVGLADHFRGAAGG